MTGLRLYQFFIITFFLYYNTVIFYIITLSSSKTYDGFLYLDARGERICHWVYFLGLDPEESGKKSVMSAPKSL